MSTDEFRELLSRAFAAARESGKRDWHRMTVAVLKNRLLQLTERRFGEASYGAESLIELVGRCSDIVKIDRTTKPQTVEWRQVDEPVAGASPSATRVRGDLWKAVLDYTSGSEYEWDAGSGQARPVERAEPSRRLPTVDRESLGEWRKNFAAQHALKTPAEQARLHDWVAGGLGTQHLPRDLQGAWNATLKQRVLEELKRWFGSTSFVEPSFLVPLSLSPGSSASGDLRAFIHQCIDVMSAEELRDLRLPAHVLLRVDRVDRGE